LVDADLRQDVGVDNLSLIFNTAALAASFAALTVSTLMAIRQVRTARHANQLPVIVEIFREMGSSDAYQRERTLFDGLPSQDPKLGVEGLPEPLRSCVYQVGNYYLMLSYLTLLEILDHRLAVLPIHYRAVRVWNAIAPFVYEERRRRGDPNSFLNVLEAFIEKIERIDIATEVGRFHKSFGIPD
jgi:hypothetical protein